MSLTISKKVLRALAAPALFALGAATAMALAPSITFVPLLQTSKTVIDEPIVYPTSAPAKITAGYIDLPAGVSTGWHKHGIPLIGMVMEGELTVDYGNKGKRTYKPGEAFVEAINQTHQGTNTGTGTLRLLAIYIGAEGMPTSIPEKAPE
jgi:quercetin dioxygenase-like cupin family protein